MILILTDANDSHGKYVIQKLIDQDINFYEFRLDVDSLKKTIVTYQNFKWSILQNNNLLEIEKVSCVWNRRTFVELLLDEEYNQTNDFKIWKNEWNKTLLGMYSSLRDKPWLNPWREAYKAENKYLQMEIAVKNHLKIPATIVSNQKNNLENFCDSNNETALKLMHQDFYRTNDGKYTGFYVNKVSKNDLANFGDSNENPIVLQEYIEKAFEVRYTVVGDKHFACKIDSQKSSLAKTDWRRYDIPNTPHEIIDAPEKIKESINNLMRDLEIYYGALDFIVDIDGNWVFLEVNSMGQFLWIEDLTGLNISQEIINWLKKYIN